METETKALPQIVAPERLDGGEKPAVLVLTTWDEPKHTARVRVGVDHDDLQAIVQQAYDQFGILATPSLEREAERGAELPDVAGMIRGHVAAAQAQQLLNSTVTP